MNDTVEATADQVLKISLCRWYATETDFCTTWRHTGWRWVVVAFHDPVNEGLVRITELNRMYAAKTSVVVEDPEPVALPKLLAALGSPDVYQPKRKTAKQKVEVAA